MSKEQEKAILGAKTFGEFCGQFGDDVYARILLEELFEGLKNAEIIFVFGEQEQERDKTSDNTPERGDGGQHHTEGSGDIEPPTDLAKTDSTDYP